MLPVPTPKMPKLTLCLPPARRRPKAPDSECNGNIASFGRISSNLIKTPLFIYWLIIIIWHLQCQNQPFVSHLLAEDSGPSIPSVVAILPNFDDFLSISLKLDHLQRFSRHPTRPMVVLTLCLPPARWGPRDLDSQCSGNIAWFRWILSNFVKTRQFIQIQPPSDLFNGSFNPLHTEVGFGEILWKWQVGDKGLILAILWHTLDFHCSGNIARFRWTSSNFAKIRLFIHISRNPSPTIPKLTLCLPPARWGPRALDLHCSCNIAKYRWISSNFIKTRLFIQI